MKSVVKVVITLLLAVCMLGGVSAYAATPAVDGDVEPLAVFEDPVKEFREAFADKCEGVQTFQFFDVLHGRRERFTGMLYYTRGVVSDEYTHTFVTDFGGYDAIVQMKFYKNGGVRRIDAKGYRDGDVAFTVYQEYSKKGKCKYGEEVVYENDFPEITKYVPIKNTVLMWTSEDKILFEREYNIFNDSASGECWDVKLASVPFIDKKTMKLMKEALLNYIVE